MNNQTIKRREFLNRISGSLSIAAMAATVAQALGFEGGRDDQHKQTLKALMDDMEAKGRQFLSVPKKDGQFLNLLVKATRAKNVLEVGTSHGYSAIWISLGLEETSGKMTTIEILPERVQLAKQNLARAGLSHRVTFKEGDAHQVLPRLEGLFDFVFLDADKEGQMDYFSKLHPEKLVSGGLIVVHNAIRLREPMANYLQMIANHPEFDSVILSLTMEDGFSVSYRHRA